MPTLKIPGKDAAEQKPRFPLSIQAGVLAAAALSFWGTLLFYDFESTLEAQRQNRDPFRIGAQYERFSPVRQAVPESAILGYLTDAKNGSGTAIAMFDSAQFALAPRLLQMGVSRDLVLGNFTKPLDYQLMGAGHGLQLERDCGNGVVLYRRQGR